MKMRKLFKDKAFLLGFSNGIIFFLCINLFIFFYSQCHHCVRIAGFPIIFWEKFVGNIYYNPVDGFSDDDFENFFIYKLILDILITLVSGFVLGSILKFVSSKISSRRAALK